MIIVITHDGTMQHYYGTYIAQQQPNYQYWRRAFVIDGTLDQAAATIQIRQLLVNLQPDEPLCLVGHGDDNGIGDHPGGAWWWDSRALAQLFLGYLPNGYDAQGKILFEACGQSVANLPPHTALALDSSRLTGLWLYGYQNAVPVIQALPNETQLTSGFYLGAQVT